MQCKISSLLFSSKSVVTEQIYDQKHSKYDHPLSYQRLNFYNAEHILTIFKNIIPYNF